MVAPRSNCTYLAAPLPFRDTQIHPRENAMEKFRMLLVAGAFLVLAGCVSQRTYNASQQQNAQLQQLNEQLGSEVAAGNVRISQFQNAIKVSVNSQLLFPSGGWEMSAEAKQTIAKIAGVMAPHQANHINVNGYTDNTPIGPALAARGVTTNMILSQKRADTVMQYMISQGVNPNMVSAHGFGEADPVATNDTAAGRAQNRRVELTIAAPAQ